MPAGMQLQHIRYFVALADEGNFTRAARRCGVSQPSLTNAIKSLEFSLEGALFERNPKGCCLTDLGTALRPHFEQLHHRSEQVLRLAKHFSAKATRACAIALCAVLTSLTAAGQTAAHAGAPDIEIAIRETMPAPVRCDRSTEPLFYCRHDNATGHTMVLELVSGADGPAASLTYNYDDSKRHELLAVMRGFFMRVGVPLDVFDECVAQSQLQPAKLFGDGWQISCFSVELGDRVTNEIFAMAGQMSRAAGSGSQSGVKEAFADPSQVR